MKEREQVELLNYPSSYFAMRQKRISEASAALVESLVECGPEGVMSFVEMRCNTVLNENAELKNKIDALDGCVRRLRLACESAGIIEASQLTQ